MNGDGVVGLGVGGVGLGVGNGRIGVGCTFAVRGDVAALTTEQRTQLLQRGSTADDAVQQVVRDIIADVRTRGDDALREMALRFDNATLDAIEVPPEVCVRALESLDADVHTALEIAARNIAAFHRAQLPHPMEMETMPGVRLGRRAEPLQRVGVYAPGGRAAYPSSVLMGVVPAKVAGVAEVIVCSPAGPGGLPPAAVLAACALAGADRVFAVGGAGAVAALALGTATVPRVDKIVGPGNAYVTEAKQQLNGVVAIDSPAGPSEVLVIADDTADPVLVAVELLAQAEHDPDAACVLVTTSAALAAAVGDAVERLTAAQPRADIIRAALSARGALLEAATLDDAIAFSNEYAPEHLLVMTRAPRALLPRLRNAGTIFLGAPSSVAFGDYMTGANHVLPTSGLARAYSGLAAADFIRWSTYQELTPAGAAALAAPTDTLAQAEGLPAHALAARMRAGEGTRSAMNDVAYNAVTLRAAYAALAPYDPGRLPCATDLSDNTSLFGPAPSVRATLQQAGDAAITRYPAVYVPELKHALAQVIGVEPENISTGCGSDDVIDSVMRAFCEPGDVVAYPAPTFGMVPVFARMNAGAPISVPLLADWQLDPDALLAVRAQATYICRPNNPTGNAFDRAATLRVCEEARGIVMIDEAYADFADDDFAAYAAASSRTIVLRTLSKAYGMAGMRAGFAVGPAELIAEVEKSRGPYKVSALAEAAALRMLATDREWVRATVAETRANRQRLLAELRTRGIATWDSAANFLLFRIDGTAAAWNTQLRARGVAVRPFEAVPGAGECLRVSIGPWPMMQQFLDAFDDVRTGMQQAGDA